MIRKVMTLLAAVLVVRQEHLELARPPALAAKPCQVLGKRLAELIAGETDPSEISAAFGTANWIAPEPFRTIGFHVVSGFERRKAGLEM